MRESDLISWGRRGVGVLRLCAWGELGLGAVILLYALAQGPGLGLLCGGLFLVELGRFGLDRTRAWKRWLESAA